MSLDVLKATARAVACRLAAWAKRTVTEAMRLLPLVSGLKETIDLIIRMSKENRLWGAERIRGELLKVGVRVGKRTVQKYMYRDRSSGPRDGQSWKTFLKNHTREWRDPLDA